MLVAEGPGPHVTVAKGDQTETLVLDGPMVKKNMLFRLHFLYGVPIHWFWNPSMAPGYKAPTVQ